MIECTVGSQGAGKEGWGLDAEVVQVAGARPLSDRLEALLDERAIYALSGRLLAWTGRTALVFLVSGFMLSLVLGMHGVSQLGMLHLPAVWLAVLLLMVVAFWATVGLVVERPLPLLFVQAVAPTGGMFTFLALWSGALWMRAVEGEWWIGDARQIGECAMLAVYLVMLALPALLSGGRRAERAVVAVALVGGAAVVALYFLVDGGQRFMGTPKPALLADPRLAWPMALVAAGLWFYATYVGLVRLRCLIKEREFGLSDLFSTRW